MNKKLQKLILTLQEKKVTLAFAESMTAGKLINEFSKCKGASDVLLGGIVTYKPEMKIEHLSVSKDTLKKYTAESRQVTTEMVKGLKSLINPDIAVAVTGLASKGGSESEEKPVGTVFISILICDQLIEYKKFFTPDESKEEDESKDEIMMKTVDFVTSELYKHVIN